MVIELGRSSAILALACITLASSGCAEPTRDERVTDTMRRTEAVRGLSAIEAVPYRFLPADEAFDDLIEDWRASDDAAEAEAEALVMQRLGLLPPDFDIVEVLEWSTRTGVLGYYDPATAEMTVVTDEAEIGPAELMVLAHEYAHALQDQHFGLAPGDALKHDEAAAWEALVEGEATLVMAVWTMKRLAFTDPEALESSDIPTDVMPVEAIPALLSRAGEFPYVDGAAFVFEEWGDGDWGAIDALWANPPVSTEQILHPERYPDDVPDVIDLPDVAAAMGRGWTVTTDMTLGELQIGVLLADGAPWGDAYEEEAFAFPQLKNAGAADGWGGDRLVHLAGPGDAWAIVWQTTWDRAVDAVEFSRAAQDAFRDLPFHTRVSHGRDITGDAHPHPVLITVTPDAFTGFQAHAAVTSLSTP